MFKTIIFAFGPADSVAVRVTGVKCDAEMGVPLDVGAERDFEGQRKYAATTPVTAVSVNTVGTREFCCDVAFSEVGVERRRS